MPGPPYSVQNNTTSVYYATLSVKPSAAVLALFGGCSDLHDRYPIDDYGFSEGNSKWEISATLTPAKRLFTLIYRLDHRSIPPLLLSIGHL
jgi:hypothetical protein